MNFTLRGWLRTLLYRYLHQPCPSKNTFPVLCLKPLFLSAGLLIFQLSSSFLAALKMNGRTTGAMDYGVQMHISWSTMLQHPLLSDFSRISGNRSSMEGMVSSALGEGWEATEISSFLLTECNLILTRIMQKVKL